MPLTSSSLSSGGQLTTEQGVSRKKRRNMAELLLRLKKDLDALIDAEAGEEYGEAEYGVSAGADPINSLAYAVKGVNPEEMVSIGVVYMPDEADLQDEWGERTVIEKAAHDWMANYRWADAEHSWQQGAGIPVESYIAPCDIHTYFGKDLGKDYITEGSWVVGMKWAPEWWAKVKNGEISGYSLGGFKRISFADPPTNKRKS
jgi:hypothetical protein